MMSPVPPRVHLLLARDAPVGVAIRRGPSKCVCTVGWDRRADEFVLGQWLRGRIYERRSDLSPDGKHMIYFAMNGRWDSEARGAWTAISRVPYLKAVELWAKGDCWNGGGLFVDRTHFWLNDLYESHTRLQEAGLFARDREAPSDKHYGNECTGVYYIRLQRDGWQMRTDLAEQEGCHAVFDKHLPMGWTLRKRAFATARNPVGKGCYYDRHQLLRSETGTRLDRPDWEWADLDAERVVWVEKGILHAALLTADGLSAEKQLYDFNPLEFEAIRAPY